MSESFKEVFESLEESVGQVVSQHGQLVKWGSEWLKKHHNNVAVPNCSTILTETVTASINGEVPDIIGWCSWASVLIEVKVDRADFLKDFEKSFRKNPSQGVGNFRYYLAPEGLINVNEVPENWGLLILNQEGEIDITLMAEEVEANLHAERTMLLSHIRRMKVSK